jgi:hypothetical protein
MKPSRSVWLIGVLGGLMLAGAAQAQEKGFLETLKRQAPLISTVPDNGDQNPYAIVVAPVAAGRIEKDDVLVGNFNNAKNYQGTGSTIMRYTPATKQMTLFAAIPTDLATCPGGIGLSTAMTMLKSGWVIVGSAPSRDGTTATRGNGCLIVLDSQGRVVKTIAGENINSPWGNMAVIDNGTTATLFVSNAGFGIGAADDDAPVLQLATVLRIGLSIPAGQPPVVTSQTVIASGLGAQADAAVFLIGPTGLALGADDTLYVSDATANRIIAIERASSRADIAGVGREVTKDGLFRRPLAMTMAPNGHLLVMNGLNGQVVEVDPVTGKQIYARWIDANRAQTPPGSGDLFGVVMTPAGDGFYYVMDEVNMLAIAR